MTKSSTKVLAALGLVAGLGMAAALPMATAQPSHAATEATTTINATVSDSISITAQENVNITVGVYDAQSAIGTFTVGTNHTAGYKVSVEGVGGTSLVNGGESIAYQTTATEKGTSGWNLKTEQKGIANLANAPIVYEKSGSPSAPEGDTINVTYSVATNNGQAGGTYTGTVKFIAATL